jgi:hypothetical protein
MWVGIARLRERLGDERAREVAEASSASVEAIGRFCEERGVDAWYRRAPYLLVSATPANDGAGLGAVEARSSSTRSARRRDAAWTRSRAACARYRGCSGST